MFLHELPDVEELYRIINEETGINESIIEKDYWVMHALWGLQQQHDCVVGKLQFVVLAFSRMCPPLFQSPV